MKKGIVRKLAREELHLYGLRLLAGRALSETEVRIRLKRRAAEADDIEPAIAKLREYGFLNDEKFAESFASTRRDSGTVGRQRALRDLRQRHVLPSVAEQAVTGAYHDTDEPAMVRQWLERKLRGVELSVYLRDEKHLASVYRRLRYAGFASASVSRVLQEYSSRASDLEDSDSTE